MKNLTLPFFVKKDLIHYLTISLIISFLGFFNESTAQSVQTLIPCTGSASDLTLLSAQVTGGDPCNNCVEGAPQLNKKLTLSIDNGTGSERGAFAFWGTLEIYSGVTGSLISSTPISGCNGPIPGGTKYSLEFGN